MNLKNVLLANGVVSLLFALGFLVAPEMNLEMYALEISDTAVLMTRFFGSAILGFSVSQFALSKVTDADSQMHVSLAMMLAWVCTTSMSVFGVVAGGMSAMGWSGVVAGLAFIAAYGYLRFGKS